MNLQSFEYYLRDEGLKASTATEHVKNIQRFMLWATSADLTEVQQISYNELLTYVQYLKGRGVGIPTLNNRLNSIRRYYEHLKQEGVIERNPARRLHIKGTLKQIVVSPLSYNELEMLYGEYAKPKEYYREAKSKVVHQRNAVFLSLMIWQGIHAGHLEKIEIAHVKLNEGTIYIPGAARSKGRELKLDSRQIIVLHQYITETSFTGEKLFDCHAHNTMQLLMNELKGINPALRNAGHIRASVILHWIKMYGKRQVQYMAGHKWIGSTEHYQVQELDGLIDMLGKHHPFS